MTGHATRTDDDRTVVAAFDVAPVLADSGPGSTPVAPVDGEDAVPDEAA
jgi:hypothetical protein